MSLKAKIEAVVYAAEEPVTLAQLAALFSEEVLEWKREHEVNVLADPPSSNIAEQVSLPGDLDAAGDAPSVIHEAVAAPEVSAGELTSPDPPAETVLETAVVDENGSLAVTPEADEKRLVRQRDREVRDILRKLLDELMQEYGQSDRGIEIREIAGGYRIGTKPEYHDSVRSFVKSLKPPMKLSLQALETLAVIAYKQPVTSPEVSEIRGVDCSGVLGSLIGRKLITTAGRKQVLGRPILYKTTKEFLLRFGLKDVNELPSIEEFEKMAGELADTEPADEPDTHAGTPDELLFLDGEPTATVETAEPASARLEQGEVAAMSESAPSSATTPETQQKDHAKAELSETDTPATQTVPSEED